jgi:hypothetical protein
MSIGQVADVVASTGELALWPLGGYRGPAAKRICRGEAFMLQLGTRGVREVCVAAHRS